MFEVTNFSGFTATASGTATGPTPPDTPGLIGWYDFSTPAQISTSGTRLTAIRDKSTFASTATETAWGAGTPDNLYASTAINGLGAMYSTNVDAQGLESDLPGTQTYSPAGTQAFSWFIVAKFTGNPLPASNEFYSLLYMWGTGQGGGNVELWLTSTSSRFVGRLNPAGGGSGSPAVCSLTQVDNNPHVLTYLMKSGTQTGRMDGGGNGTGTNNFTSTAGAPTNTIFLGGADDGYSMPGYVGEYRIFNQFLGTDDMYKEEGYLAWKWGLQGNLPSGHPYKNAPP